MSLGSPRQRVTWHRFDKTFCSIRILSEDSSDRAHEILQEERIVSSTQYLAVLLMVRIWILLVKERSFKLLEAPLTNIYHYI